MNEKIKIVVADDSPTILNMVRFLLAQEGYEVITAANGIEALEKVYQENPDLIILDIIMPKMTGYQACRILKNDKDTKDIPLILLTAQEQEKDKFWGIKTGADKYITKTMELDKVLGTEVRILLDKFSDVSQKKSLINKKIDSTEIVSLVNNLLDKQLFESTVINEVSKIAITIQDYQIIIKEILLLINKVIGYQIGQLFLLDEKENEIWIRTNIHVSKEVIENIQEKTVDELIQISGDPGLINSHNVSEKDEHYEPDEICNSIDELKSFFSKALYLRNECVGFFSMACKRPQQFDAETTNTCDLILKQGLLVIDNAKLYKKAQELAFTDGLTRLYNHRYFQEQLEKEISRTTRYGHYLSLIMIDIDHFKHFNDTYGHQSGDIVLKEVASILHGNLRTVETVARYGGEEFIVILPETSIENGVVVAERLREKIASHDFTTKLKQLKESITISLGVASFPEDATEKAQLISKADGFLYQAKNKGRNRVCSRISN